MLDRAFPSPQTVLLPMDISNDHDYLHLLPEDEGGGGRVGGGGGGGGGEEVFAVGLLRQVLRCSFEGIQRLGAAVADIVPSTTGTDAPGELEFAGGGDDPEFVAAQEEEEEAFTVALLREVLLCGIVGIQQFGAAIVANTANIISSMAGGDGKEEDEEVEEGEDSEDYDEEEEESDEEDEEDEDEEDEEEGDEEDQEEAVLRLRERLRYHFAAQLAALETVEAPSDGSDCPICLDDDTVAGVWKETPCGHSFHGRCLETWLQANRSCPMCRVRC